MTKKLKNKIYIPELSIYLDRESFFISPIYDNKKEEKDVRLRNANISGIFRLKISRLWIYEKRLMTKYYFKYGDKDNSTTMSNFDENILKESWDEILKEFVSTEKQTKSRKTKKK